MKNEITRVGIKRQVDKLGRIVIPKEYREFYHLDHNDEVFKIDKKILFFRVKRVKYTCNQRKK